MSIPQSQKKIDRDKERARVLGVEYVPKEVKPFKRKHSPARTPKQKKARKDARTPRTEGPSVDSLDVTFSLLIRALANYECQFWGRDGVTCSTQMQCMHLKSRRFRSTRWRKENAACGCVAHHRFYHDHPDLFVAAVEALWPGRWTIVQAIWRDEQGPKCARDRGDLRERLNAELKTALREAA